jgi:PIN domain nuclease of toxin-antitoxin system
VRLLLDTHILLWWRADDDRLGAAGRALLADPGNEIRWSAATAWEIAVKLGVGKLRLETPLAELYASTVRGGFGWLPIAPGHCAEVAALPLHHRDPFDRMLIAQARVEDLVLLSDDPALKRYAVTIRTSYVTGGRMLATAAPLLS